MIPGNTRDYGYFHAGVRADVVGFPGLLVLLVRLACPACLLSAAAGALAAGAAGSLAAAGAVP